MVSFVRAYHRLRKLRYLPAQLFSAVQATARAVEDSNARLEQTVNGIGSRLEREFAEVGQNVDRVGRSVGELAHEMPELRDGMSLALLTLHRRIKAIEETTSNLNEFIKLQSRVFPSWLWSPETASRVRSILAPLRPFGVKDVDKIRVGRDCDGGYVMLNSFAGLAGAISLGIADDASWDTDIADRGIRVLQYDPSIQVSPVRHPLVSFEPLRIASVNYTGATSIASVLQCHLPEDATDDLLLKMDIEGSEWDVVLGMSDKILRRFRQIVCEFHNLDRLTNPDFGSRAKAVFETLTRNHFVCHVHGNNCGNFVSAANVPIPESLEVTFASRTYFLPLEESTEVYPTVWDRPNEKGRADLFLGQFRFE